MGDRCEHCDGNGWVWQEYSTISGGDYQKSHHCMKAPMQPDPQPTAWISRPACATEAMIEAGAHELRAQGLDMRTLAQGVAMQNHLAGLVAKAVINAALKAAPKPQTVSAWRPIKSAQNAEVPLYFPPKPMGRHNQMTQPSMYRVGRADEYPRRPTHWQPLPEPPATGDVDHG